MAGLKQGARVRWSLYPAIKYLHRPCCGVDLSASWFDHSYRICSKHNYPNKSFTKYLRADFDNTNLGRHFISWLQCMFAYVDFFAFICFNIKLEEVWPRAVIKGTTVSQHLWNFYSLSKSGLISFPLQKPGNEWPNAIEWLPLALNRIEYSANHPE